MGGRVGSRRAAAVKAGYRSGFEHDVARSLQARKVRFTYESKSYGLILPVNRKFCGDCGSKNVQVDSKYTPDFFFKGKVVETKGKLTPLDRKKILAMLEQYPKVDYRVVFEADNKLSRSSKTRYSEWAEKNNVTYAVGGIPDEWLR